ncbi:ABSCISIC ACID-INSENSITIVE 5-like protein [Musa troglodytarum]|uniref:ABSCISIC ACID-INSENSITIVE 5-like protein n=1 Tax=Musa troglodytarum TaxID=320322 RepID=A0A9E7EJP4_9LILI|nr:ABSCISIC ACID-INSENSITIVE 5-like protein [Musa troglodytarum]URD77974.1 ABSCISIC ACID-INSENSITIVE 5-like protein [Musa troglodytarum]URD77975.1 ABSCISIC ACID-INSENSITIVE 5-like protein [Musa troglodytarum]
MGIMTMASQGGVGSSGDGQRSQTQGLSRQGSFYNMTLNEVQNHLGEPLHSMNLDDLLKTVFVAEGNQLSSIDLDSPRDQYASNSGLHRQGSITMSRELSKKTVDEVWRDIQLRNEKGNEVQRSDHDRQPMLGEMTLEDFLVKAGVVAEGIGKDRNDLTGNVDPVGNADLIAGTQDFMRSTSWLQQFQRMATIDQQIHGQQSMTGAYMPNCVLPQPMGAGTGPMLEAVFPKGQINISSPTLGAFSDSQTPSRKHGASEDLDILAERRQKRMIKNRESAARSRARKQAYTNELENKVSHLEKENEKLKKQKELDKILLSVPLPEPRYQLRRTSSSPF